MNLGDNDLNNAPNGSMAPSLGLGDMRGQRYPNQFFDLSQQYMPPTIKELFRWCTFYFYNSPLIGATMKKVSRYPVTDLIFDDAQESTRALWEQVLVDELKLKERLIEINLDYHVYGNAFVSIHLPFTRFLICPTCGDRQPINQWDWSFRGSDFHFSGKCGKCGYSGSLDVKDVPYKDRKGIRIIRWNSENMHIKFNEYTGRYIYMYTVPSKLRNMIIRGDKDILEDTPLIVIEALSKRRMIRLHPDNIFHLRAPTLAEQDQGWGKPSIIHVLKDMYYFYTLRRAQEAIAMEHIIPLDILYPLPNAQQDPYIHTDLAAWRVQVENIIKRHRRDPNFKGVVPVPLGTLRVGGDGKMLLLSPELNYLNQTIVGGLGMSAEMLFGQGTTYTGSSIQLRMMENDFIQNRSQLIDFVRWVKDKVRIWMAYPNLAGIRFTDFRMADDVQRNQQLIGLNAQGKVSDQTLLSELGYDWEQESQKLILETQVKNYLMDLQTKGSARSQGEAQIIQANYQKKMQDLMGPIAGMGQDPSQMGQDPSQGQMGADQGMPGQPGQPGQSQEGKGLAPGQSPSAVAEPQQDPFAAKIESWANKLLQADPAMSTSTLTEIKAKMPAIGLAIEQRMNMIRTESQGNTTGQGQNSMNLGVNMSPLPVKSAPRRAEAM